MRPLSRESPAHPQARTRWDANNLQRRPEPTIGLYEIKLFPDQGEGSEVEVGDGRFFFAIPEDLNAKELNDAQAFVSTFGAGNITMQVRHYHRINVGYTGWDMLSSPVTIPGGDFTSFASSNPSVVDHSIAYGSTRKSTVYMGDMIAIDIDTIGAGALGMGAVLRFVDPTQEYVGPAPVGIVVTQQAPTGSTATQVADGQRQTSSFYITP